MTGIERVKPDFEKGQNDPNSILSTSIMVFYHPEWKLQLLNFFRLLNPFFTGDVHFLKKKIQNIRSDVSRMRDDQVCGNGARTKPILLKILCSFQR